MPPPTTATASRRRAPRPTANAAAPPISAADEQEARAPVVKLNEEASLDASDDPAVSDLFSAVLRWDFDALVARGGAAEASPDDLSARQQLKQVPLTFKDANVSRTR